MHKQQWFELVQNDIVTILRASSSCLVRIRPNSTPLIWGYIIIVSAYAIVQQINMILFHVSSCQHTGPGVGCFSGNQEALALLVCFLSLYRIRVSQHCLWSSSFASPSHLFISLRMVLFCVPFSGSILFYLENLVIVVCEPQSPLNSFVCTIASSVLNNQAIWWSFGRWFWPIQVDVSWEPNLFNNSLMFWAFGAIQDFYCSFLLITEVQFHKYKYQFFELDVHHIDFRTNQLGRRSTTLLPSQMSA